MMQSAHRLKHTQVNHILTMQEFEELKRKHRRLHEAVKAVYMAGVWSISPFSKWYISRGAQAHLWEGLRDAAELPRGESPKEEVDIEGKTPDDIPTPRTDEQAAPIGFYSCATIPVTLGRQLERELALVTKQRDDLAQYVADTPPL